jgi:polyadenylate-binding protein
MILTATRLEDESALVAKVNEAMAVYEDYVKSQQGGASQAPAQGEAEADKPKEEKAEEKA